MLAKIYVEITNRCNLRCSFCPGTTRPARDMTPEEFARLAPALRQHTRFIYFHLMGEPLLHPQLADFFPLAHASDLRIILTTNGALLPARAGLLLAQRALHKVNISLQSLEGRAAPAYLCACCDFAKAASRQGIVCCLRLWNLDADGKNAENDALLCLLRTHFTAPWKQNTRGFRLAPKVFLEFGQRFDWPDAGAPDYGAHGFCYALRDQAGILSDGTVVPCCLDHDGVLALGNAFTTPFSDILAAPPARAIYDGFSGRQRTSALCRHCGYASRFIR